MSDLLSQEQIDALLNSGGDGGGDMSSLGDGGGEGGAQKNYDALRAAFEMLNEHASTVLGTVLNKEIAFSITKCEPIEKAALAETIGEPALMLNLPLEGGIDGALYLTLHTRDVARLADLMLMGDGAAEYNEDHKDAISELFSQVMGAFVNALGEKAGETVSAGDIQVNELNWEEPPFALEDADMVMVSMTIPDIGEETIGYIAPNAAADQLIKAFADAGTSGGQDGDGDVGLSAAELDDLSEVTSDIGDQNGGFSGAGLGGDPLSGGRDNINMLLDVDLDVSIELGRADLSIKRILEMAPGSIIELDRLAGEPVDLMVNNKVVAKGEVVVVDENFGIRIVSLVSPEERIKSLR
jgi:flagellar motor switch protein FliN/FliY